MISLNVTSIEKQQNRAAVERPISVASLAVIMPVRNEEQHIGRTLDQLLAQDREGVQVEILVVDGQSEDRAREIVSRYTDRYAEIRLLENPDRLSSAARNIGVEQSTSDYVVIIDGHCEIPSNTYFVDLVQAFESTGADCLGRPQPLDVSNATPLQSTIALARASRLGHHPDSFIYSNDKVECPATSVAIAYRRGVFEQVGMFDTRFDACEDCEFNHRIDRAGLRCYLIPKLAIKYEPRSTYTGLFRQLFRYGRGRVRLFRKCPESFSGTAIVPALFIAGALLGPPVCIAYAPLWIFYFAVIGCYFLALLFESIRLAVKARNFLSLIRLPIVFSAIHCGSGFGVLSEFLFGKKNLTSRSVEQTE